MDVVINAVDVREFLFSKQVRKIAKMRLTGIAIVAKVKANKSSVVDFELVGYFYFLYVQKLSLTFSALAMTTQPILPRHD